MAMQTVTVAFAAVDTMPATWTAPTGNFGIAVGATVTDSLGPIGIDITARTATGCTLRATGPFSGSVELIIYDKP